MWNNWLPETGYIVDPQSLTHDFTSEEMPRRTNAPGLSMGLTVVLDVEKEEYFCSGFESIGFKALLHAPITTPEMVEFGFALSPGTENFISVSPEYIFANEAIHHIDYEIRQCFLESERSLHYYQHYTYLNCFLECVSNHTFKVIYIKLIFWEILNHILHMSQIIHLRYLILFSIK